MQFNTEESEDPHSEGQFAGHTGERTDSKESINLTAPDQLGNDDLVDVAAPTSTKGSSFLPISTEPDHGKHLSLERYTYDARQSEEPSPIDDTTFHIEHTPDYSSILVDG